MNSRMQVIMNNAQNLGSRLCQDLLDRGYVRISTTVPKSLAKQNKRGRQDNLVPEPVLTCTVLRATVSK